MSRWTFRIPLCLLLGVVATVGMACSGCSRSSGSPGGEDVVRRFADAAKNGDIEAAMRLWSGPTLRVTGPGDFAALCDQFADYDSYTVEAAGHGMAGYVVIRFRGFVDGTEVYQTMFHARVEDGVWRIARGTFW